MKILDALLAFLPAGHAAAAQADRIEAAFARQEQARGDKLAALDAALDAETQSRAWLESDGAETRRKFEEQARRWPAGLTGALRRRVEALRSVRPEDAAPPRAGDETLDLARRALDIGKKPRS